METDPLTWGRLLTSWNFSPLWTAICVVAVGVYAALVVSARRAGRSTVPRWRVTCWMAGVVLLAVCSQSGLDRYALVLLWVHMVQHLALIMVIPALLVLGSPLAVLQGARGRPFGGLWFHVLGRAVNPLVGFVVYVAVIFATHLTSFLDVATTRPAVHVAEQVLYLVAGVAMFWPLLGDDIPRPTHYLVRLGVLFVAMMPDAVVGIVLLQSSSVLAPGVGSHRTGWGPTALVDQQRAGGIMWVFGDALMMVLAVVVALTYIARRDDVGGAGSWLESVRRATLADALHAQGLDDPLTDSSDLDADDVALEAYNAMLRNLDEHGKRR